MLHKVNVTPAEFDAFCTGTRRYDLRKWSDKFKKGDLYEVQERDPNTGIFSGRSMTFRISCCTEAGEQGLKNDYCIVGLE